MERNILLGVIASVAIILAVALFIPGGRAPEADPTLPWEIGVDAEGHSQVFGLTLGRSTLTDVQERFQTEGSVRLFSSAENSYVVEAYFKRLSISGLLGSLLLTLEVTPETAAGMYERGVRTEATEGQGKKVTLAEEDLALIGNAPIKRILFVPAADLDEELVRSRFGEPDRRIDDPSGISHWLYPQKGLAIGLDPEGREALHYVSPADFDDILRPLTPI